MRRVSFVIFLTVLLSSCISDFVNEFDKIGEPYWNPQFGAPIVSGEFSIEDYVDAISDDITITQDEDGVVIFEYKGDPVVSDFAEDLIEVPNQSFNKALSFNLGETNSLPGSGTISKSYSFDNDVKSEEGATDSLDSLYLKGGDLLVNISGDLPVSGKIDLIINSVYKNGVPVSFTYTWDHSPSSTGQNFSESISLVDAYVDFTKNNTTTNNFNFEVDLEINYEGQLITPVDEIDINIEITDPKFSLVYGKFSEREFETERETVLLGLLEKVEADAFYLDDPQIEFNFKSSYGVPVEASILALEAYNKEGESLPFTGSAITNPTNVLGPNLNQVGSFIETNMLIDKTNSNISDIIAFIPTELDYQFKGKVKPVDPLISQFVLDTSQVIGEYTIRLPLSGHVTNFTSEKEFEFDGDFLDAFNKTKLVLKTTNGLPLTVAIELVFTDENSNEILTLFSDTNILNPGTTDSNGLVTAAAENRVELDLTADELEQLSLAKQVFFKSTLMTGEMGVKNVKVRIDDKVKVSMFIQTSLDL